MPSVICNHDNKNRDSVSKIMTQAAALTGCTVHFHADARDIYGRRLPNHFCTEIRQNGSIDFSPFWAEYRRLEALYKEKPCDDNMT